MLKKMTRERSRVFFINRIYSNEYITDRKKGLKVVFNCILISKKKEAAIKLTASFISCHCTRESRFIPEENIPS
jgi:hypothetical protein